MITTITSALRRYLGASSLTYWIWRQQRMPWVVALFVMVVAPWVLRQAGWLFTMGFVPALWYLSYRAIKDRQSSVDACAERMIEAMRRISGSSPDCLLDGYSAAARFLATYAWATARVQVVSTPPPDSLRLIWRRHTEQVMLTFQGDKVDCTMVRDAVPYSLQWKSGEAAPSAVIAHLKSLC